MLTNESAMCHFKFQAVPEIFVDYAEKASQDATFRATTLPSLGIIERSYPTDDSVASEQTRLPWEQLKSYIEHLNEQESGRASYKVLYITRHGLGYHNVFEAEVGREAWNNHWSHLSGSGEIIWEDAHLIDEGIQQATLLGQKYADAFANDHLPVPKTIYTSPLARCLETTKLVFEPGLRQQGAEFRPYIKELLRERLTDHTCDKRSSKTWITQHYPEYILESSFSEEDRLWTGAKWESNDEHVVRKQKLLEDIFEKDHNNVVALVTHSYAISAILEVIGMGHFRMREGGSIALLVRGEKVAQEKGSQEESGQV